MKNSTDQYQLTSDELQIDEELMNSDDSEQGSDEISEVTQLSKRAYHMLKENLVEEAEKLFQQILQAYPKNNYALVGLGDINRKKRRYSQAVKQYKECLSYHPSNNYAYFGLADSYKAQKKLPEAIAAWQKYLEKDPQNITVLTRVADTYRKLKDFRNSKKYYDMVLEIDENNAYALIGLGHLYFDFEVYESALTFWEQVYRVNPASVDIRVLTSIGNCHRKLKTFKEGLSYFLLALEKDKNNFFALFGAADCHRGLRQYEQSLAYWLKILDNDPQNKVILTRAGDAYRVLKDLRKAKECYDRALEISFDYYAVLGLVSIHKENGEYTEALDKLHDLISRDRKNHRLYIEAANCYLEQGYKAKAIQILKDFHNLGLHNIYVKNLLDEIQN
ncbi:MAG: tetratricopeptide repeat protein [Spirochaetia bacterium]|nr:tetratricopeptide repeat protein [Spirochaetia bacterium]